MKSAIERLITDSVEKRVTKQVKVEMGGLNEELV